MPTVDDFMFLSASSTAVIKCWNMSRVAKRKHLPEAERFFHYDEHSRVAETSIYFINGTENGRYVTEIQQLILVRRAGKSEKCK